MEGYHSLEKLPPHKRQCRDKDINNEIDTFLNTVSSLPLDELGEDNAKVRLTELVSQLTSSSSPEVQAIIDNSSSH